MAPTAEPPDTPSAVGLPRPAEGTGSQVWPAAAVAAGRTAPAGIPHPWDTGAMDVLPAWDLSLPNRISVIA